MKEKNKSQNEVELTEEYAVIEIPTSTVEVEIIAKTWHNGEIVTVKKTMDFDEIRNAIKEAQESYIPPDAVFKLTELGEKMLDPIATDYHCPEGFRLYP